jgi:large subunit ribosomal protein L4
MKVAVLNKTGKETGNEVELSSAVFGVEPNEHAVYLDVKQHLGNRRQGTHKAKERANIRGSTRKIKRQKGTGTARAGDIKSPIFRGGGRAFGPRPRSYRTKLNKSTKRLARRSALSSKAKDGAIAIVEKFELDAPRTKDFLAILKNLKIDGKKSLIVLDDNNKNVYLSSRNLKNSEVITLSELNTYSVMKADKVVFFEGALEGIESNLSK